MCAPAPCYGACIQISSSKTARVLSVGPDQNGIPHVRFAVSFERARFLRLDAGTRLLALTSFTEFYREPVEAAA